MSDFTSDKVTVPTLTTGGTGGTNQRIIDWIRDELHRVCKAGDTVSTGDAYRIAYTACEKTLRAVSGL